MKFAVVLIAPNANPTQIDSVLSALQEQFGCLPALQEEGRVAVFGDEKLKDCCEANKNAFCECTVNTKEMSAILERDALGLKSLLYGVNEDKSVVCVTSVFPVCMDFLVWKEASPRCRTIVRLGEDVVEETVQEKDVWSVIGKRRTGIVPREGEELCPTEEDVDKVLEVLERVLLGRVNAELEKHPEERTVTVLFSGGLDSTVLAALLAKSLKPEIGLRLVNVAFAQKAVESDADAVEKECEDAPDRKTGRASFAELRRENMEFVAIDKGRDVIDGLIPRVMGIIHPSGTHMDAGLAIALWTALDNSSRIVVSGQGADELFAGYTRYRAMFKDGWEELQKGLECDLEGLWERNLGRESRLAAERGKCVVMPFLDPEFIAALSEIPLCHVCNLNEPQGVGDKKLLRAVASKLGVAHCALQPKRAMQFGTRIAKALRPEGVSSKRARGYGAEKFCPNAKKPSTQ